MLAAVWTVASLAVGHGEREAESQRVQKTAQRLRPLIRSVEAEKVKRHPNNPDYAL